MDDLLQAMNAAVIYIHEDKPLVPLCVQFITARAGTETRVISVPKPAADERADEPVGEPISERADEKPADDEPAGERMSERAGECTNEPVGETADEKPAAIKHDNEPAAELELQTRVVDLRREDFLAAVKSQPHDFFCSENELAGFLEDGKIILCVESADMSPDNKTPMCVRKLYSRTIERTSWSFAKYRVAAHELLGHYLLLPFPDNGPLMTMPADVYNARESELAKSQMLNMKQNCEITQLREELSQCVRAVDMLREQVNATLAGTQPRVSEHPRALADVIAGRTLNNVIIGNVNMVIDSDDVPLNTAGLIPRDTKDAFIAELKAETKRRADARANSQPASGADETADEHVDEIANEHVEAVCGTFSEAVGLHADVHADVHADELNN